MKTRLFSKTLGGVKHFVVRHKFISLVGFVILLGVGYWGVQAWGNGSDGPRYVLAAAEKKTIIVSVSGTGQVSASSQVDIKPKVSGDILSVSVTEGQQVKAGSQILQIDSREAQKAVRDAVSNLDSAKLSLAKLKKPADTLSLTQAENALARAEDSKQDAEVNLKKAYDDGFNAVSNAFLDLPSVVSGVYDILYSSSPSLSSSQWNIDYYANNAAAYDSQSSVYRDDANTRYQSARLKYDSNFSSYKGINRFSPSSTIESMINQTYETTKTIAEAVKSANNLIQFYDDKLTQNNRTHPVLVDTHLSSLNGFTQETNTHLVALLNAVNSIKSNRGAIEEANRSITENTQSLAKLKNGTDDLDLQTAELAVRQRENALADAREELNDYYVRAPFDGTVANVTVKRFDSAGSGSVVATLITKQQFAEISLNEVDAAKIKVGQKASLTFDAVEDLRIAGKVAEVDAIGTVSQGVVTYNVKIAFDTQDDRVKGGMTVNASITTEMKTNVLAVPSVAVKTQGSRSYVQILTGVDAGDEGGQGVVSEDLPIQQIIETGISNDTLVEIVSGLNEGDLVVVRTTNASGAQASAAAPSLFGSPGGATRNAGGTVRTITR